MTALATVVDVEAVAGPQGDTPRVERLIEMASAVVEAWCGRSFTRVEDDVRGVVPVGGRLRLPDGPIESITSIAGPAPQSGEIDLTGVTFTEAGMVSLTWGCWSDATYTVTYTHGFDPIPDDVILAVCQVVARHLSNPDGIRSESIGEAAVVYTIPGTGYALGLTLSPVDKDLLAPYRRTVSSVQMVR